MAHALARRGIGVTLLTTNYDLGLDVALAAISNAVHEPIQACPFPAYVVRLDGGRSFRYAKIHGCISEPASLMYTYEKLAAGVLRPEPLVSVLRLWHAGAEAQTLVMSFGYGFNDPDLRPIWEKVYADRGAVIVRSERPPKAKLATTDEMGEPEPSRLVATEVLKDESLGRLKCRLAHSGLFSSGRGNLACELARRIAGWADPESELEGKFPEAAIAAAGSAIAALEPIAVARFLGELTHAAYRGDALETLGHVVASCPVEKLNADLVELYLRQFGHAAEMSRASEEARKIRSKGCSADVEAITWAYESFADSLRLGGLARVKAPFVALRQGGKILRRCSPTIRHRFAHYRAHYWLKVLQKGDTVGRAAVNAGYRWVGRWPARKLVRDLENAAQAGEVDNDARFVAEVRNLLAQALICAGNPAAGREQARWAQEIASGQNAFSVALQLDRTLAWCALAERTEAGTMTALHAFAQGLLRATYVGDPSLRPKMGLNLLRVVLALPGGNIDAEALPIRACETKRLLKLLHRLREASSPLDLRWGELKEIGSDVLASCPKPAEAKEVLRRYGDIRRYPVVLF